MANRLLQTAILTAAWLLLTAPTEAGSLRVLTYNIHHGAGTDGVFDLSRIASIISAANPDIVSLQEVDNGVPRTNNVDEVARLAQLTGMQSYFAKARPLDGGSYGDGVLLRPGISIVNLPELRTPESRQHRAPRRRTAWPLARLEPRHRRIQLLRHPPLSR